MCVRFHSFCNKVSNNFTTVERNEKPLLELDESHMKGGVEGADNLRNLSWCSNYHSTEKTNLNYLCFIENMKNFGGAFVGGVNAKEEISWKS